MKYSAQIYSERYCFTCGNGFICDNYFQNGFRNGHRFTVYDELSFKLYIIFFKDKATFYEL